jgi:CubicO group peptidase (beta-lactamase class C family)
MRRSGTFWVNRLFRVIKLVAVTSPVLFAAPQSTDSPVAQIARVEAVQSPNRQGLDPYTVPEMMERFHIPGVSIAVEKDFQIQWVKSYGTADVVTGTPVKPLRSASR